MKLSLMTFSDLDQDYSVVWSQVELSEEDITIISDCCPVCDPPFLHHLPVELSEREDVAGVGVVGVGVEGSDQSWSGCVSIS